MASCGQGQKVQKVMVQPINLIFRYLQNRSRIQAWLYKQVNMRIEGCIIMSISTTPRYVGFDESMNLVLDDAEEIHSKTKSRKQLGVSCVCATRVTRGLKPAQAGSCEKGTTSLFYRALLSRICHP